MLLRQGRTLPEVESTLRANLEHYEGVLRNLTPPQVTAPVAPEKWTPAEVNDHVCRANRLYLEAARRAGWGDPPFELPLGRLTDDGRMMTEAALPELGKIERRQLAQALTASVEALIAAAQRAERSGKLGTVYVDGGFFGPLTGLETVQLASAHIFHHARQLPR